MLAPPQLDDGTAGTGIDAEVVATDPLDSDDQAGLESFDSYVERGRADCPQLPPGVPQRQLRPTRRTSIRLGVKAPVARIVVLGLTIWTHREMAHRRQVSVIWKIGDDAVAWPTVGAIGEWILEAPVGGVEDLGDTVRTGRDIRQDDRPIRPTHDAFENFEAGAPLRIAIVGLETGDQRPRGQISQQTSLETVQIPLLPLDLDLHSIGRIPNPPGQPHLDREAIDVGAKSDALDGAPNIETQPGRARSANQPILSRSTNHCLKVLVGRFSQGQSFLTRPIDKVMGCKFHSICFQT
jgi:hypothetical protein